MLVAVLHVWHVQGFQPSFPSPVYSPLGLCIEASTADSAALLRTNPSQNNTVEPLASRKQLNGNIRPVEGVSGAPAIVEEITYLGK